HFLTNTTIDTLDYSGDGLNAGSKVTFAAVGGKKRELATEIPASFALPRPFDKVKMVLPGVLVEEGKAFTTYEEEVQVMERWCREVKGLDWEGMPLIVLADDAGFTAENPNNFVWVTFTRSN